MRARMAIQLAKIRCEIREIRLNNKPEHMLKVSPKGTVPVLILEDKIIDESIEIIEWALDQYNVPSPSVLLIPPSPAQAQAPALPKLISCS